VSSEPQSGRYKEVGYIPHLMLIIGILEIYNAYAASLPNLSPTLIRSLCELKKIIKDDAPEARSSKSISDGAEWLINISQALPNVRVNSKTCSASLSPTHRPKVVRILRGNAINMDASLTHTKLSWIPSVR
jgi:hypothetical protein